jgi:predicted TIM-barrel fold metal-dependent hydrolase
MSTMDRRQFIAATIAGSGSAALLGGSRSLAAAPPASPYLPPAALVDTNVTLGLCPFRRLPLDDTRALVTRLREQGVTEAWAGSFDSLLHKDLSAVNARLAEECRASGGLLLPIGAINPALPDWREDLRRCAEVHRMRGIRLHPNYHGYTVGDPAFAELLDAATMRGLLVQICVIMEDERTLHPRVLVPPTDTTPLAALLQARPRARVQLLNAFRTVRGKPLAALSTAGARFEIATLEGVEGITKLLVETEIARVCFGSHAPFFYFESAALKLKESVLSATQLRAIAADNARWLIPDGANKRP